MDTRRFAVTSTVFIDAADADEAALMLERRLAGAFDSELLVVGADSSASPEELAHLLRQSFEQRFGWSLVYFDELELRSRFASRHGYDDAEQVPDEVWMQVWPILRSTKFWTEAGWLDDFIGDTLDYWLEHEEVRSFPETLRDLVAAWKRDA